MKRRSLLAAIVLAPAAVLAQPTPKPRHKVSAAQLHQMLSARFPVRFAMGGFFQLQVSAPALLLLPRRNRLGATLLAEAGGPGLEPLPPGEVDVVFRLRYEPSDRSLRALEPEVLALRWPGLPADFADGLKQALPGLAREAIGEIVLHQFTSRELALPEAMGFEPDTITVVEDGLSVGFGPKKRQ